MSNSAVVTSTQSTQAIKISPQWKELKKRARTLKITSVELAACENVEQLRKLAKRKYHEQVKKAHPDSTNQTSANHAPARYGLTYNRIIAAYKWIVALPPESFARAAKNRATVHDGELPLDWGIGWAEYDRRYDGFTILPRL